MNKRELLIVRHAKSSWDSGAPTDFERPLSRRGLKNAPRVGRFLLEKGLVPDYVVSSPARRAQQTASLICEQVGIAEAEIQWDRRIYHAATGTLMDVLNDAPADARRVMIAGHNPGLEMLVETLSRHEVPMPDDYKLMPTAAVAHLSFDGDWKTLDGGDMELLSITRARSLSE